eukprot:GHVT01095168.1.p1 GENE.GHVT01095168.1~~GHVT01095168.1.p1  ORF type:complete len:203 (+),score=28.07 GHVT01095168.1:262-870(+)
MALQYISALFLSLSGQFQLELPHVNVLSKIDLLKHYKDQLHFRLDYYAEVQDLSQLLLLAQDTQPMHPKFIKYSQQMCELLEEHNLISFRLCDIQDKESALNILKEVDTANGFLLGSMYADLNLFDMALGPTQSDAIDDVYVHWRPTIGLGQPVARGRLAFLFWLAVLFFVLVPLIFIAVVTGRIVAAFSMLFVYFLLVFGF